MPTSLPPRGQPAAAPEPPSAGQSAVRGPQGAILGLTLLLLAAVLALPLLRPGGRRAPLRVVVVEPRLERAVAASSAEAPSADDLARVATATRDALERGLAARAGLTPAADDDAEEAVDLELRCDAEGCEGTLRRLRSVDGGVLWRNPGFRLPLADDPRVVAQEVDGELQLAFLRFDHLEDGPRLFARAEDYAAYLQVRRAAWAGDGDPASLAGRLEAVRAGSPRFSDAYLLEARLRLAAGDTARGVELLRQARRIAAGDRRVLELLVPRLLDSGATAEVTPLLRRLESRWPRDPMVEAWRRRLDDASSP